MQLPNDLAAKLEGKFTVSVAEFAEIVSVSLPTAYASVRSGQVKCLRFGERAIRIPVGYLVTELLGFEEKTEGAEDESRLPVSLLRPNAQPPAPIFPFPNGDRKAESYESHSKSGR